MNAGDTAEDGLRERGLQGQDHLEDYESFASESIFSSSESDDEVSKHTSDGKEIVAEAVVKEE